MGFVAREQTGVSGDRRDVGGRKRDEGLGEWKKPVVRKIDEVDTRN